MKLHARFALAKQEEQKAQRLAVEPDSGSDNSLVAAEAALHRSLDAHHKQVARHIDCAGNPVLDNLGCLNDQRNLANLNIGSDSAAVAVAQAAAEQELVEALEAVKPLEPELTVSERPLAQLDSLAEQHSEPGSEPDSELQEQALG